MHILQHKHLRIKADEANELFKKLNISPAQLPKIKSGDPGLPKDCKFGDIIRVEREDGEGKKSFYYRVVV